VLRKTRGTTAARRAVIGAVALLVPALAGCEAGLNAPTQDFHPASNGAYAKTPDNITINNLFVLGGPSGSPIPAGGSAGVFLALANKGTATDSLVGVSAPGVATSVKLDRSVSLAPGASALLTGPVPEVVLNGLTRPLAGGQQITLKLEFARAGQVTVPVPVEPHDFYFDTFSPPAPSPTATATATPTTSASASPTATATGTASPSPTATTTP
jgi:copper(I)-binding protein